MAGEKVHPAPSWILVQEFLGECWCRQYLNPLVCVEVLYFLLGTYSLLDAAFVVSHLALSEMDSLCKPTTVHTMQETRMRPLRWFLTASGELTPGAV